MQSNSPENLAFEQLAPFVSLHSRLYRLTGMIPLFIGITMVNLLSLGGAMTLGYLVKRDPTLWSPYHQLAGVLATIACVAIHCIVFTYFIATAKWVQHAVTVKQLDPALTAPTRSFKAQAFPAALGAMAIVFLTAISGAATFSEMLRTTTVHHALAIASLAVNALVALVEYRAIVRNGRLIDDILEQVNRTGAPAATRR